MFMQLYNHLIIPPSRAAARSIDYSRPFDGRGAPRRPRRRRLDGRRRHAPAELAHVFVEYGRPDAVVHELPVTPRLDEAGTGQFLQVMRDRRLSNRKAPTQPATADFRPLGDVLQDFESSWIGQRFGDPLELLHVHGRPTCVATDT